MIIFTIETSDYSKYISSIISNASNTNFSEVLSTTKELYSFYSNNNMLLCNIISEVLFKLYKSLDIPFNDHLAMIINCDSILREESVENVCTQNPSEADLDYTRLNFYEEKYTSVFLISNIILSHPELKKITLDIPSFLKVFSLVLDTQQEEFIKQNNIIDYNKEE